MASWLANLHRSLKASGPEGHEPQYRLAVDQPRIHGIRAPINARDDSRGSKSASGASVGVQSHGKCRGRATWLGVTGSECVLAVALAELTSVLMKSSCCVSRGSGRFRLQAEHAGWQQQQQQ